jgi:DNA-binding transcriptional ArsR family regulator
LTLLARLAAAPGWLTVTAAASCCGVHLSGVSRHLRALFDAGLLEASREGREVRYRLDCRTLAGRLRGLADALERCTAACGGDDATCCAEPTGPPAPLDPENQIRHAADRGEETSR